MYSCHSILECYNLFSGVKLSNVRALYMTSSPSNHELRNMKEKISEELFSLDVMSKFKRFYCGLAK